MNKIIYLSIVSLFLLCFINNEEVLARTATDQLDPKDPRLQPEKYCDSNKCTPTIRNNYAPEVNIRNMAARLNNQLRGFGTDEKTILKLVSSIGSIQRIELSKQYIEVLKRFRTTLPSLEAHLKKELSGRFEDSILAILTPLPILYAHELQKSMNPIEEQTLVEILCTVNNFGVKAIVEFYKDQFHTPLIEDVKKNTAGSFQKVLVSVIEGKRAEGENEINEETCADDVKTLNTGKPWKDKPEICKIFGTRSYAHLRKVFVEYKKISGREIEEDIKKEFPEPELRGLLAFVKCIKSKVKFFADNLEEAMKHHTGPKMDRPLIRILVSRSEIDLEDIKIEYEKIYKTPLEQAVGSKVGSDYKRALISMIRGNSVPASAQAPPPPSQGK